MKLFNVTIERRNTEILDNYEKIVSDALADVVTKQSALFTKEIQTKYFKSSFGALTKDGKLARSIKPIPTTVALSTEGSVVYGGVDMGEYSWAKNFIGPRGQTVIVHGRPWLAIPMSKEASDQQKTSSSLHDLSLFRIKHLLFRREDALSADVYKRRRGAPKRKSSSPSSREGSPLFILKRAQAIRAKIHPEEIAGPENTVLVKIAIERELFKRLKVRRNG